MATNITDVLARADRGQREEPFDGRPLALRAATDPVAIVTRNRDSLEEMRSYIHAMLDAGMERLQQLRKLTDEQINTTQGNIDELIRAASQALRATTEVQHKADEIEGALIKMTERRQ